MRLNEVAQAIKEDDGDGLFMGIRESTFDLGFKRKEIKGVIRSHNPKEGKGMNRSQVNNSIFRKGGQPWLKKMSPFELFNVFKSEYEGTAEIIDKSLPDDDTGWILFIEVVGPEEKNVIGYFYQRGEYPKYHSGKLKYRLGCWYLAFDIDVNSPPMLEDFTKQVFNPVTESEVDS